MRALLLAGVLAVFPDPARAMPAGAVQARKLEAGKSALERLRADPRRRRYREGWESVLRTLDAAVKAAPRGSRAAEAALMAGRARAELWEVSRSRRDARAAIAALRKVDEDYSGPTGAEALALVSRDWRYGRDLIHLCFPHAAHDEKAWGMRLHLPMQFFTGAVARASRRSDREINANPR